MGGGREGPGGGGERGDPATWGEVVKPESDTKEYRAFVLGNGIECLAVHDAEADKAGASCAVGIGYYSDPEGFPGLSHFLEHMLFYSSEKYPEEDGYSKFLRQHNGNSNAYTAGESTNFMFDVAHTDLEPALDRFAQFFIAPKMSPDGVGREVNAVDSEHKKNLQSDVWRNQQLGKLFLRRESPAAKFGTGTLETLLEEPKKRGEDVVDALWGHYRAHYASHMMKLVVLGRESLDELQQLVEAKFSQVPTGARDVRPVEYDADVVGPAGVGLCVRYKPVTEGHSLELQWPVPPDVACGDRFLAPAERRYRHAPLRYAAHLLGHEGEGSVFFELKRQGWAQTLYCGAGETGSRHSMFMVHVVLTDEGQARVPEVVAAVYAYLDLLRKKEPEQWIFDECAAVARTTFHTRDRPHTFNYVSSLAAGMHQYAPEDWVSGAQLMHVFDPVAVRDVLSRLTPPNCRVFWGSSRFEPADEKQQANLTSPEGGTRRKGAGSASGAGAGPGPGDVKILDRAEEWYGTAYHAGKIPVPLMVAMTSPSTVLSDLTKRLHLPARNPFIATDLALKGVPSDWPGAGTAAQHTPKVVYRSQLAELWWKPDTRGYDTPKAMVRLAIGSPLAYAGPDEAVMTRLFVKLVDDALNAFAYFAEVAGLEYGVENTQGGVEMVVRGYSHKLGKLTQAIVDKLCDSELFEDRATVARFEAVKEKQTKEWTNTRFDQPYSKALYCSATVLDATRWNVDEYLAIIPGVTLEDVRRFASTVLWRRAKVTALAVGNISADEARALVVGLEKGLRLSFGTRPAMPSQSPGMKRSMHLPAGIDLAYQTPHTNPADENSAVETTFQTGASDSDTLEHVLADVLVQLGERPAFYQLRTVEQLGYIVFLGCRLDNGVHGIRVIVQSSEMDAASLDGRIEAFLEDVLAPHLKKLGRKDLKEAVDAVRNVKTEKLKNIREEHARLWKEIENGSLRFGRLDDEVRLLDSVTQGNLWAFFDARIRRGGVQRAKLSTQVFASAHVERGMAPESIASYAQLQLARANNAGDDATLGIGAGSAPPGAEGAEDEMLVKSRPGIVKESVHEGSTVLYVGDVDALKRSMAVLPCYAQGIAVVAQAPAKVRARGSASTATAVVGHAAAVAAMAAAGWAAYSYFFAADGKASSRT